MDRAIKTTIAICGLLGLLAPACVIDDKRVDECDGWCSTLNSCGLLPSPLGLQLDRNIDELKNCTARCVASDESYEVMRQCIASHDKAKKSEWCTGGSCSSLAECIRAEFGTDAAGVGSLQTRICLTDDPMTRFTGLASLDACSSECESSSEDPNIEAGTCSGCSGAPGIGLCEPITVTLLDGDGDDTPVAFDADRATVQLETPNIVEPVATGVCTEVLAGPLTQTEIPVGRYRGSVLLFSQATGGLSCVKFYNDFAIIEAGSTLEHQLILPDPTGPIHATPCETSVEACSDGLDNDLDTLPDCADVECASHCLETEARCIDGLDNDADGLIDCDDPTCAAWPDCSDGDSGTETGP